GASVAASAGSIAEAFASTAQRCPGGALRSQWPISVLLPAPAKPATTVTGNRDTRAARSATPERRRQDHEEGQQLEPPGHHADREQPGLEIAERRVVAGRPELAEGGPQVVDR